MECPACVPVSLVQGDLTAGVVQPVSLVVACGRGVESVGEGDDSFNLRTT